MATRKQRTRVKYLLETTDDTGADIADKVGLSPSVVSLLKSGFIPEFTKKSRNNCHSKTILGVKSSFKTLLMSKYDITQKYNVSIASVNRILRGEMDHRIELKE